MFGCVPTQKQLRARDTADDLREDVLVGGQLIAQVQVVLGLDEIASLDECLGQDRGEVSGSAS